MIRLKKYDDGIYRLIKMYVYDDGSTFVKHYCFGSTIDDCLNNLKSVPLREYLKYEEFEPKLLRLIKIKKLMNE